VTDPSQFAETNANAVVKGEWNSATISCANVAGCGLSMGNTYGVPVVTRLHDGKWGVIFGNGFGSTTGDAGIFIMVVDPLNANGAIAATYYLSTGVSGANGISSVYPSDFDGDHIVDYVYAGDLLGNIWRFDLTSDNEANWSASSQPLFTTPVGQPITTKLLVASTPQAVGPPRIMIDFGTGRKIPQNNLTPPTFAAGVQSLYGIWDWNFSAWDAASATQLASLAGPEAITAAKLTTQTLTVNADLSLDVTSNPVCWSGSTTCAGGPGVNSQFGFKVALPGSGEQVIYNPLLYHNALIVNTSIPANNSPTSCQVNHDLGNTIAISVSTGGAIPGFFRNSTDTNLAGSQTNGTGTPFAATAGGLSFLLTQSLGDGATNQAFSCPPGQLICTGSPSYNGSQGKRLTWVERR